MLQRHELEIDRLYSRPQQPIALQCPPVRAFDLFFWIGSLHDSHAAEEAEDIRACEDRLVGQDTSRDGEVGSIGEVDPARQEAEPGRCGGAEDS